VLANNLMRIAAMLAAIASKSGLIFMAPLSEASRAAVQLLIYINLSIRKSPFDREIVPMMH
jgi:hypothetical protein